MSARPTARVWPWLLGALGGAAMVYGALASIAWWRYGHAKGAENDDADPLLDAVMPAYDIVERHRIRVRAPANVTLKAATEVDLLQSPLIRAIFRTRELAMGADRDAAERPMGLLDLAASLGWGVLAEQPGREIVMGAVLQPWLANVIFQPLSPERFRVFATPDYVKIAWTLRADPDRDGYSIFRTETRAVATDTQARVKFRRYWSLVSPGVWSIRRLMLVPVKRAAEARSRAAMPAYTGLSRRSRYRCQRADLR